MRKLLLILIIGFCLEKTSAQTNSFTLDDAVSYALKNNNITNEIIFYTPTKISSYRASTYLSKEKDTIEWIEKYGEWEAEI